MSDNRFSKWVAVWGNATSISEREISTYSKNITLRYPIFIKFDGNKLRFHFSNFTGTEDVRITKAFVALTLEDLSVNDYKPIAITFKKSTQAIIPPKSEIVSDEIPIEIKAGQTIEVSLYFSDFTQMNSGTLVTGPLSNGKFAYGDFSECQDFPPEVSKNTNWFYFLNTIDIFTEEKNYALICYGDSITAQSWPDFLTLRTCEHSFNNVSIIRRAVCGTRILRQYNCITYAAYGLKGELRFPYEMKTCGAKVVIIQHGINDIIHPVGVEVNQFRPWSDMPTAQDLIDGFENIYLKTALKFGYKVYGGTLLPIYGWRTYEPLRDKIRNSFNEWIRTSDKLDGCVDFDKAVRDKKNPERFRVGFDSGDHLHPSQDAYKAMAESVDEKLLLL